MIRRILAGSLVLCGVQSQAFAGDTNFTIQLPLLDYSSEASEVKPKEGDKEKETTTGTLTSDLTGGYFQFSIEDLQVYVYPFDAESPRKVSVGYVVGPIEAGVNLGIANEKEKESKKESNQSVVGLYGVYVANLGSDLALEAGLTIDTFTNKTKGTNEAGEPTKSNTTGTDIGLGLAVVKGISKNLSYVGGLTYNVQSEEEKESEVKTTNNALGVNLASFRYVFN